jgi:hypothetical protein
MAQLIVLLIIKIVGYFCEVDATRGVPGAITLMGDFYLLILLILL